MAKRLVAKIGEYQKDGQTKGEYVKIGVILSSDNGEYVLIDPTVNLAGVLIKQRIMNPNKAGTSIMCGIYSDEQQQQSTHQGNPHPGGFDDFDDDIPF